MGRKQARQADCDRKEQIIGAATEVFLRYGYTRTTMGDIADQVGISRPALYLVFPGKDDIFAAVIARMSEEKLREIRKALSRFRSLERRLRFCCEEWGAHGFDLVAAHPDASDLFNLQFVAVREMYAAFEAFLVELLAEPVSGSQMKATPAELARILVYAMRGFKYAARDGEEMRRMIAVQVGVVAAALGG